MEKKEWSPTIKPVKIFIYPRKIQEKIYKIAKKLAMNKIREYNQNKTKGTIIKANAYGSIINGNAGIYNKVYNIWNGHKRYGSDLDLAIIVEKGFKPPKSWKYIKSYKDWYDEYTVDIIDKHLKEINQKKDALLHPINFIIMIIGKHNFKDSVNYIGFDEKESKTRGYNVENWYINKKKFNKLKIF